MEFSQHNSHPISPYISLYLPVSPCPDQVEFSQHNSQGRGGLGDDSDLGDSAGDDDEEGEEEEGEEDDDDF